MQGLVVVEALILGLAIATVEWTRPQPVGRIDFLRAVSGLYAICFVGLPLYLQVDDLKAVRSGLWVWILKRPFDEIGFAYAGALALIGYLCLVVGWSIAGGLRLNRGGIGGAPARTWRDGEVYLVAMLLGSFGLMCLLVYMQSIGGLGTFLFQAAAFRGTDPPVVTRFAFLKSLTPMVMAAAILLHSLRVRRRLTGQRPGHGLSFGVFLVASLLVLIHQAGRFPLAMFLVTFPLAKVIRTGRLRARLVIAATAFILVLLLFGKQLVESGLSGSALSARVENVGRNATSGIRLIAIEFAFPVATLANATREVPGEVEFRWFYDLPLAVAYLVPQRLLGVEHPPTVSMVNTARFGATGAVPVDLLSFGYFSAGVPGVVLLMLVVGTVLVFFERILPPSPDPTDCILRAAWILFAAVRVMYGDPQLVWSGGLHLILMALVFVAISLVLHGRTLRGSRAVVVGTPGSGL